MYRTIGSKVTAGEFLRKTENRTKTKTASEFSQITQSICAVGCAGLVFKAAPGKRGAGGVEGLGGCPAYVPLGDCNTLFLPILLNYLVLLPVFKV